MQPGPLSGCEPALIVQCLLRTLRCCQTSMQSNSGALRKAKCGGRLKEKHRVPPCRGPQQPRLGEPDCREVTAQEDPARYTQMQEEPPESDATLRKQPMCCPTPNTSGRSHGAITWSSPQRSRFPES